MSTIAQAGSDGCCFGQEIRKLAYDGAVQSNLYGCDPRSEFFNLGYRLFRDRDTLKSTFIEASEKAIVESGDDGVVSAPGRLETLVRRLLSGDLGPETFVWRPWS